MDSVILPFHLSLHLYVPCVHSTTPGPFYMLAPLFGVHSYVLQLFYHTYIIGHPLPVQISALVLQNLTSQLHSPQNFPNYGSLNVIDLHRFIGSGVHRRCGFVAVGMALLEEVCYCEGGL